MRMLLGMWRIAPTLVCVVLALVAHGAAAQDKPKIEITPQIPHTDLLYSVAFSPDGRACSRGAEIRLSSCGTRPPAS